MYFVRNCVRAFFMSTHSGGTFRWKRHNNSLKNCQRSPLKCGRPFPRGALILHKRPLCTTCICQLCFTNPVLLRISPGSPFVHFSTTHCFICCDNKADLRWPQLYQLISSHFCFFQTPAPFHQNLLCLNCRVNTHYLTLLITCHLLKLIRLQK